MSLVEANDDDLVMLLKKFKKIKKYKDLISCLNMQKIYHLKKNLIQLDLLEIFFKLKSVI